MSLSPTSLVLVCVVPSRRDLEIARFLGWNRIPLCTVPKDEANHPRANEEYYKIQIGGLEKLKQLVFAEKWKRITFLNTTGDYLLRAKTLNELVVDGDERQLLWHSRRERAENAQLYKADLPEADVPPEVLMALLGSKEVQGSCE